MRRHPWLAALAGLSLILSFFLPPPVSLAQAPVQVLIDGRLLALNPPPFIVDGRTLVPLRGVFEAMGAVATWDGPNRTVTVTRGDRYVRIGIDRRLATLDRDGGRFALLDVPAKLIQDWTFVPVRFITTAMGARVSWDGDRRAVLIETNVPPNPEPAPLKIDGLEPGRLIREPISLRVTGLPTNRTTVTPGNASTGTPGSAIQFFLLNPSTGSGPIVAAGPDPQASYTFTPDPSLAGKRLILAAVRDSSGAMRYSDPVPVTVEPDTKVRVTGLDPVGQIDGPVGFTPEVKFVATHVAFKLIDPASGGVEELGVVGPGDRLIWYPQIGQNGDKKIQAVAFDRTGRPYESDQLPVKVRSGYRTAFWGIENGAVLTRPVGLRVAANYPIESIKYLLDDRVLGWGYNYAWNFGPEANGPHTLRVEVTGKDGALRRLDPISFTVKTSPQVWLSGVGPDQVVTGPVTLKISSNVKLSSVKYFLSDETSGRIELLGQKNPDEPLEWTPKPSNAGQRTLYVTGFDPAGQPITSQRVSFRIFLGKIYGPQPVVPKAEFKELATRLAIPVYRETGMSAALQVAQAILETAWGQSVPVDKYTGQPSLNLFGIKGKGPVGSVTSNTWEEYNGVAYRVDDNFRAYHSVEESWRDHSDFLMLRPWYAPFRAVMADPVLGAWALRKSGYATDSRYPIKLIGIMKTNDLFKLDEVQF